MLICSGKVSLYRDQDDSRSLKKDCVVSYVKLDCVFDFCRCDSKHVRAKQKSKKRANPKENKNDEQLSKEPSRLKHCDLEWMMKDEDEKEGIYRLDILNRSSGHGRHRVYSIMSLFTVCRVSV